MSRTEGERGQVIVLTVIAMTVLLGMTALVLDVGAWFHSKRQLQATADAAALAGAQMLPQSPGSAQSMALNYANQNGGGVAGSDITITGTYGSNDTIEVKGQRNEPGFFSKILGVDVVDVRAGAKALVGIPYKAKYVAPMVVKCSHPLINDCDGDTSRIQYNQETTLSFDKFGAPGAFGMLDLANSGGNTGSSTLADWIEHGYNDYLPIGKYDSDPGVKFNSGGIDNALANKIGDVLLFPVYDTLDLQGSNAEYNVIGWIGFHLDAILGISGNNAKLQGYFTEYIAQGILPAGGGPGSTNLGVKSIQLIG